VELKVVGQRRAEAGTRKNSTRVAVLSTGSAHLVPQLGLALQLVVGAHVSLGVEKAGGLCGTAGGTVLSTDHGSRSPSMNWLIQSSLTIRQTLTLSSTRRSAEELGTTWCPSTLWGACCPSAVSCSTAPAQDQLLLSSVLGHIPPPHAVHGPLCIQLSWLNLFAYRYVSAA
jgi:hypothetical protein